MTKPLIDKSGYKTPQSSSLAHHIANYGGLANSTSAGQDDDLEAARRLDRKLNGNRSRSTAINNQGTNSTYSHSSQSTNSQKKGKQGQHAAACQNDETFDDGVSVRSADQYNYDMLMNTEGSFYGDGGEISCYDLLCGTPRDNEPVFSFLCFSVSKRVVKNISMFIFVLLFYVLVLSVVTSNKKTQNDD